MFPIHVIAGTPPMQHLNNGCYHSYVEWLRKLIEMPFSTVHDSLK